MPDQDDWCPGQRPQGRSGGSRGGHGVCAVCPQQGSGVPFGNLRVPQKAMTQLVLSERNTSQEVVGGGSGDFASMRLLLLRIFTSEI